MTSHAKGWAVSVLLSFYGNIICHMELLLLIIFSEPTIPVLVMFSVYTNGRDLFKVRQTSNSLECLNGIRVLSMMWIMLLHSFSVYHSGPLFNGKGLIAVSKINNV